MARILVVGDHPPTLDQLEALLQDYGFAVELATSSVETLRKLRQQPPAVVLLDLDMPMLDSWALLQEYVKQPGRPDVPVVVLASSTDAASAVRKFRPYACLRKPLELAPLLETLKRATAAHEAALPSGE